PWPRPSRSLSSTVGAAEADIEARTVIATTTPRAIDLPATRGALSPRTSTRGASAWGLLPAPRPSRRPPRRGCVRPRARGAPVEPACRSLPSRRPTAALRDRGLPVLPVPASTCRLLPPVGGGPYTAAR